MQFQGKGRTLNDEGMDVICRTLGVSEAQVWAVMSVETRGFGFLPDRRPQILFERHIFHKLTAGRFDRADPNVSDFNPGGYRFGASEYTRLDAAMRLDRDAALQSASWGIGQVMGFNYPTAGFANVEEMVAAMVKDENSQLLAMANFIKGNNLAGSLQRQNWVAFARGYNGPDFKRNDYDNRLAAAHAKYTVSLPDLRLRTAQGALLYIGIDPGAIDGVQGRRTRSALIQFQERAALPPTGELDRATEAKLLEAAFSQ